MKLTVPVSILLKAYTITTQKVDIYQYGGSRYPPFALS